MPEKRGCKTQTHSPKLHCFLFHPDCASECCPVSPLFPGSTSDLPGHFLQVAGVCSTLSQQAFNACFPRLSFKMLLSCFWHPEMCNWHCKQCGKKEHKDIPEWNPYNRNAPGDGKCSQMQEISNMGIPLKIYHIPALPQELLLHAGQVMLQVAKTANCMLALEFNSINSRRWQGKRKKVLISSAWGKIKTSRSRNS